MTQDQADIIIAHMILLEQNDNNNPVLEVLGDLIMEFEEPIAEEIKCWKIDV